MSNRQIKFRAWDSKNKKFPFIGFHIIGECTAFDLINQYRLEELNDLEIQQFTGLQDSTGADIYEGDIIEKTTRQGPDLEDRFKNHILRDEERRQVHPVIWGDYSDGEYVDKIECWMFDTDSLSELINRTKANYQDWIREYKIIGNIFENPNLLKKL